MAPAPSVSSSEAKSHAKRWRRYAVTIARIKQAVEDATDTVRNARKHEFRVGLGVNPETPVESLFPHLEEIDSVLVMTLYKTGYAGQPFNDDMLRKIATRRRTRQARLVAVQRG